MYKHFQSALEFAAIWKNLFIHEFKNCIDEQREEGELLKFFMTRGWGGGEAGVALKDDTRLLSFDA